MTEAIVCLLVGVICIALGFSHRKGNISSLHSYHTRRVSEEDKLPFGKRVGLGTIIIGASLVAFGACNAIAFFTEKTLFTFIGMGIFIAGLIVGGVFVFSAMIKYNKGIF